MFCLETLSQSLRMAVSNSKNEVVNTVQHIHPAFRIQVAGLKNFKPPVSRGDIVFPERAKLKYVDKVPQLPTNIRPPKMMKRLDLMRGPELVHNFLLRKQYGIVALHGGRLRWGHFEMIRLTLGRKLETSRMFAEWRVDPPWQPVTKKGQGQRMGGGKGAIDHYVTPIKAGRIIVEVGGHVDFAEIKPAMEEVAQKLPFAAKVVTHDMMIKEKEEEKLREKMNMNPFTFEYIIRNNMGCSHHWMSPKDRLWFGKYQ